MADVPAAAIVRVARARRLAQDWALALASQGISTRVTRVPSGFAIEVAGERLARAAEILDTYDRENPPPQAPRPAAPPPPFSPAGFVTGGLLIAFFLVTGARDPQVHWFADGNADAQRIAAGELWRCVTALTLHADLRHVLSNAVSGTLFIGAVCGALGFGVGGAAVLLSGAIGNLANALFHGAGHHSVGASTAVFGAIGLLCALTFANRRRETRLRRAWLALGAGLALLAMLGTAGERVDLWAHLFGLLAGLATALPLARRQRTQPGPGAQLAWAFAALFAIFASWVQAIY